MTCKYAGKKHPQISTHHLKNNYTCMCEDCDGQTNPGCGAPTCNLVYECPEYESDYKETKVTIDKDLDFKPGKLINWLISQQELSDKINDRASVIANINQEQFGDLMHDPDLKESQKLFIADTLRAIDKDYYDLEEWDGVDDEYNSKYKKLREKIKAMCI